MKSDFLGLFMGGFLLGTLGLAAMQPADSPYGFAHAVAAVTHHQR